jgi:hypothetical protein
VRAEDCFTAEDYFTASTFDGATLYEDGHAVCKLHHFYEGMAAEPQAHIHGQSFFSCVLKGSYDHCGHDVCDAPSADMTLWRLVKHVDDAPVKLPNKELRLLFMHTHRAGSIYFLPATTVHTVTNPTLGQRVLTLVVQGKCKTGRCTVYTDHPGPLHNFAPRQFHATTDAEARSIARDILRYYNPYVVEPNPD